MNTKYKGHSIVPGLRIWKTALAVFLCLLINNYRNIDTIHSGIAAVICMKSGLSDSWQAGFDRFIGTLIAGIFSYLFLLIFQVYFKIEANSFLYALSLALCIVPLMGVILHGRGPGAVSIGAVVFLIICATGNRAEPLVYAIDRVIDTVIGIGSAVFVNWIPFLRGKSKTEGSGL